MNIEKFTLNASKRISEVQTLANTSSHAQISSLHLLSSMLTSDDSLVQELLLDSGVDISILQGWVKKELAKLPRVEGNRELRISNDLNTVLLEAEKVAAKMKDEFITEEHLLLSVVTSGPQELISQFKILNITPNALKTTIEKMRGGETVTNNDPENKMNALKKYGIDLVDLAKKGKIDPVIGREEEIRRALQILSRRTKNNPVLL
jgi:ATP-dependent Clp protease ATP-binding subunit ClpB